MATDWNNKKDFEWRIENNLLKTNSFSLSVNDIESYKVTRPLWSYIYEFIQLVLALSLITILFNFDWKAFAMVIGMMFFYSFVLRFITKAKILHINCKGKTYQMKGYNEGRMYVQNLIKKLDEKLGSRAS